MGSLVSGRGFSQAPGPLEEVEKKKKNSSYFHTDVLVIIRMGAGYLSAKSNVLWNFLSFILVRLLES